MTYDVLPALEFNAVHCGDVIARVYFAEAADRIRVAERERDRIRRRLLLEQVANRTITIEAQALERALAITLEQDHG